MKFPAKSDIKGWYQSSEWTLAMVQDALNLGVITQVEFEDIITPTEYPPVNDEGANDIGNN